MVLVCYIQYMLLGRSLLTYARRGMFTNDIDARRRFNNNPMHQRTSKRVRYAPPPPSAVRSLVGGGGGA